MIQLCQWLQHASGCPWIWKISYYLYFLTSLGLAFCTPYHFEHLNESLKTTYCQFVLFWNKLTLEFIVAQNNGHFLMLHDSVGQKFSEYSDSVLWFWWSLLEEIQLAEWMVQVDFRHINVPLVEMSRRLGTVRTSVQHLCTESST